MDARDVPYRKTLFVCTHCRPAEDRVACANPGRDGLKLLEALKRAVKERGLKGIRVARSGCLDLCEKGPNAFLYPDGRWFSGLCAENAEGLLKRLADDV